MRENIIPEKPPFPIKFGDICEPEYLEKVHQYVGDEAQKAFSWYMKRKNWYANGSQLLRFFSILFIALGGIMPFVAVLEIPLFAVWSNSGYKINQLGYIFFAIAGALLLFDRCFGFTSAWIRFVTTAVNIEKLRTKFEFEYLMEYCKKKDRCEKLLLCIEKFIVDLRVVIEKETATWAAEYSSNLARLEGLLKNGTGNK
jgi:hypothetical protein